jgi:hypothetical protein
MAARPPQSEPLHPKYTLQMREQHLYLLAIAARLLVGRRFGNGAGDIACRLVNVPRDLATRRLRAVSRLERTRAAVGEAREVGDHVITA